MRVLHGRAGTRRRHALISKIMGINTAGAISVLLTSGEERLGGISVVGPRYIDP